MVSTLVRRCQPVVMDSIILNLAGLPEPVRSRFGKRACEPGEAESNQCFLLPPRPAAEPQRAGSRRDSEKGCKCDRGFWTLKANIVGMRGDG